MVINFCLYLAGIGQKSNFASVHAQYYMDEGQNQEECANSLLRHICVLLIRTVRKMQI
jgi:hypothetical protein